ncbi:unnamed protein product [Heligmosomoides polygyrus]|uniref:BUB1 N-terminal domain-containing protein n=1 Tax=Heligmosomoides polygyrus TaxID=6339 RepID=A0A183F279_HELPZ|nr:unnamed protein product [Heligmosomoides polygyrus]
MPSGTPEEEPSQPEPSEFVWELCRENALTRSACGPKAQTLATQKFDETMQLCEASSDPLKHCLEFCTWFDQTFPNGRQRLYYSLLWKIVNKYAKLPEYLDDERMLRIWEKLADNSLDHGWEIYQHANSIGSLLRHAPLYVRWSQDLEMRGAIADARAVLRRARRVGALPLDAIDAEEDQLEMREIRRHLQSAEGGDDSWDEDALDENGKRVAFTRLAGS